jgi:hypothetical protein
MVTMQNRPTPYVYKMYVKVYISNIHEYKGYTCRVHDSDSVLVIEERPISGPNFILPA